MRSMSGTTEILTKETRGAEDTPMIGRDCAANTSWAATRGSTDGERNRTTNTVGRRITSVGKKSANSTSMRTTGAGEILPAGELGLDDRSRGAAKPPHGC